MASESFKRDEFIRRKKEARSEIDTIAQQLTNVYRQLSVLGEEAGEHFNQQLIRQASPEVLAALKTIPGGEEVREYYNFLTHADTEEDTDLIGEKTQEGFIEALLPKAEQISPVWETFGIVNSQGGPGPAQQKPVQMSIVNPIRASVITSLANGMGSLPFGGAGNSNAGGGEKGGDVVPQQSHVDFTSLQEDIDNSYESQKKEIMQALNFIVIDSNIEKMHQNLKFAINTVTEHLNQLKDDLKNIIDDASEKAAYPEFEDEVKERKKHKEEAETEKVVTEKSRRFRSGQKFSVDMTDNED
ncbi:MAG: hypothetical protein J6Y03_04745 [Alphaproteobacteria bacterium]|nr:hypothetical protein [Alphaproteobacteria bacterium]